MALMEPLASSELTNFLVYGDDDYYSSALLPPLPLPPPSDTVAAARERKKKRQRQPGRCKNKEEAESQRMSHIAVERNRRRQMNEHLAVLRSLMPKSFVRKGDQASIVGGAIDFVKELEQLLLSLEAKKRVLVQQNQIENNMVGTRRLHVINGDEESIAIDNDSTLSEQFSPWDSQLLQFCATREKSVPDGQSPAADVEVKLIETHANLRILSPKRRGQLLKMVAGLEGLQLAILHITVTTLDPMVLYSINAKVEEGCSLTSADDIAAGVHHMLSLIEAESSLISK